MYQMYKLTIILIIILTILPFITIQDLSTNQIKYNFLHVSRQFQHKFNIDVISAFSPDSDVTAVIVSCGQINLLKIAINSFFHFNTYPIRSFIVVDYCELQEFDIWQLLPFQAAEFKNVYFKVHSYQKKFGRIAAIDEAYSQIETKYVYHFSSEWAHTGSYGFIQRLKDALQDAQKKNVNVSQVVQTLFNEDQLVTPSILHRTEKAEKYFILSSHNSANVFEFNPHFFNFFNIYKSQMNHSYALTTQKLYQCDSKKNQFKDTDECLQHFINQHLSQLKFHKMLVNLKGKSIYKHININDNQIVCLNLQNSRDDKQEQKKETIEHKVDKPIPVTVQVITPEVEQQKHKDRKQSTETRKFLYILTALVILYIVYKFYENCKNYCKNFQNQANIKRNQNTHQPIADNDD